MSPTFTDLGVPSALVKRLNDLGFTSPFPIQAAALPDALAGRDVVGQAATGSGKTLAFGLALLARLERARPRRPRALVLVPTRELATQVQRELAALSPHPRGIITIFGGTPYAKARRALDHGVDVVVACPGRLEDLLAQRTLDLGDVTTVVIDEADRMTDMGFLPAVRRILALTPTSRHTMLFSATLGPEVSSMISDFTRDAAVHDVIDHSEPNDVDHHFWRVGRDERVATTARIVDEHRSALVFTRTKHGADRLARQLGVHGVRAAVLHGGRTQAQRERALTSMAEGRVDALVATDVAARGIHIDALPVVVHFDPPAESSDYVHRSGRTGRAGESGTVITLVTDETAAAVQRLRRSLGLQGSDSDPTAVRAPRAVERQVSPPEPRTTAHPSVRSSRTASAAAPKHGRNRGGAETRARHDRTASDEAVVTFFNGSKGFGFASDGQEGDLFVHFSQIVGDGYRTLTRGERILFDEVRGPKGREARNVRPAVARSRTTGSPERAR
ncbi:MAG TPA: DEAD/DEAH box helicase [Acidimicrobiales bacterium]|nr:DEAD/DEAH box helicase [Acidimicrobiales bacterium]